MDTRASRTAMQIYVMHNGEQLGPFSPQDAQAQINSGNLLTTDYAWTAGLDDWTPLGDVLSGENHALAAPAILVNKHKVKTLLRSKLVICCATAFVLIGLITTLGLLGRGFRSRTSADLSLLEKVKDRRELMPLPQSAGVDKLAKLIYQKNALESPEYAAAWTAWTNAESEAGLTKVHASSGANLSAKLDAALQAAQAVVAKYPEFALGYNQVGTVYSQMGLVDEAITAYQQAVKLDPTGAGSSLE